MPFSISQIRIALKHTFNVTHLHKRNAVRIGRPRRRLLNSDGPVHRLHGLLDGLTPARSPILVHNRDNANGRLITHALRHRSRHRGQPFITVGYNTVPRRLVRSRLFNRRGNTFANTRRHGIKQVRTTGNNALFLSRVNSLPLRLRTGLLHFLRRGRVRHINNDRPVPISIQMLTTARISLRTTVRGGHFHRSLCCHLGILRIIATPLHRQRNSLSVLTGRFSRFCDRRAKHQPHDFDRSTLVTVNGRS